MLSDIELAVQGAREAAAAASAAAATTGGQKAPKEEGSAPVYGMASALPAGPVKSVLNAYLDIVLKV